MIDFFKKQWQDKAIEKTTTERKQVKGQKATVMANAVLDMVHEFCIQSSEFAKAVVEGGSFADCMTAVAKGVGSHISDIDAYKKAVQFYMPGAEIVVQMQISTAAASQKQEPAQNIMLSLDDLLGV
ncbi:MAG: hypothetical protein IJ448_01360 [Oscillospiraceae bacterium]|nr:hypothetical protein [Oscillospiraceae bacterium]